VEHPDVMRIVTVCTHNRTRSVMTMALIQAGLDERLGPGRADVRSLGFGPESLPPIPDAVDAMRRRGLDVSGHRSRRVTAERLDDVDLVLASERQHVVGVAGMVPELFSRTFTLPEFVGLVADDSGDRAEPLSEWLDSLSQGRDPGDYLRTPIPELADPTGLSRRRFRAATDRIEAQCVTVVDSLAPS